MNGRLVTFLYILMRDDVTPGRVEQLMVEHVEKEMGAYKKETYSNKHLAKYAVEIGKRILKRNTKPSIKKQEAARKAGQVKLQNRLKKSNSLLGNTE